MALQIIRGTDPIVVEHPIILIHGTPGVGKTSLAQSTASPLHLDFDLGVHRSINRKDSVPVRSWRDIIGNPEGTTKEEREGLSPAILAPYDTVIPDTVGRVLDVITAHIVLTDKKKAPGGSLSQQGFGVLKTQFNNWMNVLLSHGKDVVLVAHTREDKKGEDIIYRPDLVGGSYAEVLKRADFVGFITMRGDKRILDWNPNENWIAKNPGGWPAEELPTPANLDGKMTDILVRARQALGRIAQRNADAMALITEWKHKINQALVAGTLDAVAADVKAIPQAGLRAQVESYLKNVRPAPANVTTPAPAPAASSEPAAAPAPATAPAPTDTTDPTKVWHDKIQNLKTVEEFNGAGPLVKAIQDAALRAQVAGWLLAAAKGKGFEAVPGKGFVDPRPPATDSGPDPSLGF